LGATQVKLTEKKKRHKKGGKTSRNERKLTDHEGGAKKIRERALEVKDPERWEHSSQGRENKQGGKTLPNRAGHEQW